MTETALQINDKRMKIDTAPEPQGLSVVMMAMQKGYDVALIEKMMDLQQRNDAYQAKKAYTSAMAEFKRNPPKIEKDRHVKYQTSKGVTEYDHATLANVCDKIAIGLGACGLHASWKTEQVEGKIRVTCTITHDLGHSESTSLTAAPDDSGSKNSIQAIGSTISYLERYTLLALTGLATHDMDDDSGKTKIEYITTDQQTEINDMITDTESSLEKFLSYMKAESIETILAKDYQKAINALKAKGAKK